MLATDPIITNFLGNPKLQIIFLLLSAWALIWKGFALWRSSRNNQRNWFIVLLIVNTFGILEIVYMFYCQSKKDSKNENIIER